jgi:hypothetical protein
MTLKAAIIENTLRNRYRRRFGFQPSLLDGATRYRMENDNPFR